MQSFDAKELVKYGEFYIGSQRLILLNNDDLIQKIMKSVINGSFHNRTIVNNTTKNAHLYSRDDGFGTKLVHEITTAGNCLSKEINDKVVNNTTKNAHLYSRDDGFGTKLVHEITTAGNCLVAPERGSGAYFTFIDNSNTDVSAIGTHVGHGCIRFNASHQRMWHLLSHVSILACEVVICLGGSTLYHNGSIRQIKIVLTQHKKRKLDNTKFGKITEFALEDNEDEYIIKLWKAIRENQKQIHKFTQYLNLIL
ncbi:hypothetical protein Glove_212g225 [Diversispora epigaea]|uniref:Uncharacterized protein n=1 Tax=Diversispora epigaea TaxID=1348612 RepID=A0A397IRY4_9GLOM|nr:hypothetical protein Glove_212g225 [Diversispora epigaea]